MSFEKVWHKAWTLWMSLGVWAHAIICHNDAFVTEESDDELKKYLHLHENRVF